jgi:predicted Rossmann fold flavoprotein
MKCVIIGGGAAGMAAALFLAEAGAEVCVLEQNEKLGKKLFITGKGRCNFTNACDVDELFAHIVTNPRFLYSSFYGWDSNQTIDLFEKLGVKTKIERGNRAFPASDHSSDIIRALEKRLREKKVHICLRTKVSKLLTDAGADGKEKITGVLLSDGTAASADAVVLATGGLSYPSTGATGDGYRFAEETGHRIAPCRPALVPLVTAEAYIPRMQGLSLRNVTLRIPYGKKKEFKEFGELLFTHFGISGPLALSASSYIGSALEENQKKDGEGLPASLDLKPALTEKQLDDRLLREFGEAKNKEFKNVIPGLFPASLRPVMLELSGIPGEKPVREVTKEERKRFIALIKSFPFTITGTRSYNEAIITQGGVSVRDVNPSTMESRRVSGLFFAGEVLDLDGVTGGYNLQIAWATAHTAAEGILKK